MERTTYRARIAAAAVALVLVAAACGGSSGAHSNPTNEPGTTASPAPAGPAVPADEFVLFDGSTATLAMFGGQPVVLNFWASWCPSCVAEMSQAFRPAQDTYGADVTFIGMNIQDQRNVAIDLLEETGVAWVNAEDPQGTLYRELGGLGMPFTVFINAAGEVVDVHNGPLTEAQLTERIVKDLIG